MSHVLRQSRSDLKMISVQQWIYCRVKMRKYDCEIGNSFIDEALIAESIYTIDCVEWHPAYHEKCNYKRVGNIKYQLNCDACEHVLTFDAKK